MCHTKNSLSGRSQWYKRPHDGTKTSTLSCFLKNSVGISDFLTHPPPNQAHQSIDPGLTIHSITTRPEPTPTAQPTTVHIHIIGLPIVHLIMKSQTLYEYITYFYNLKYFSRFKLNLFHILRDYRMKKNYLQYCALYLSRTVYPKTSNYYDNLAHYPFTEQAKLCWSWCTSSYVKANANSMIIPVTYMIVEVIPSDTRDKTTLSGPPLQTALQLVTSTGLALNKLKPLLDGMIATSATRNFDNYTGA